MQYAKGRPEYYEGVDKLKSCFHMSQNQAEAAVVETANKMFGRNWKYHDEGAEIDVDTLLDKKNTRRVGKCIEAMALSEIVMEVVSSDDQSTKQMQMMVLKNKELQCKVLLLMVSIELYLP